jgi:serine protease Do
MTIRSSLVRRCKPTALAMATVLSSAATLWLAVPGAAMAQSPAAPAAQGAPLVRGLPDFADLAEAVGPSVVNIRTLEKLAPGGQPGSQEEQMLEFFRRFGLPLPPGVVPRSPRQPRGAQPEERPRGVGSGFILSADGYIMTNAHVVEGADELVVTLTDKREFKAKVVGADKRSDIAVVKIDASGLQPVKIGDVGRLRVGEWVMAIGSPFGLESTVTAGIVSAKQRETGDYLPFIQTDVAINPGNSGGPLLNMRGEVVGINSQIYSRSGGFQGISFAIPIDEAVRVSEQLRAHGKVVRGRIGVSIDGVSKEIAESLGLGKAQGALVRGVESDSPAAKAGVEAGDIIVKFDGKNIEKSADLPRLVGNTRPGSKVTLTVWRRGSYKDLRLTVGTFEDEQVAKAGGADKPAPKASGAAQALGLTVRELSADERAELKLRGGVVVLGTDGAAARAGLVEGDVVLAVANREITGLKDFEAALGGIDKSRPVTLLVRRGDWAQYVIIRPNSR